MSFERTVYPRFGAGDDDGSVSGESGYEPASESVDGANALVQIRDAVIDYPRNYEEEDTSRDVGWEIDVGRADPAANELTRALFLPFVACPLGTERPDPRCLRMYNDQATRFFDSNADLTRRLRETETQLVEQILQLTARIETLKTEKTSEESEKNMLKFKVDGLEEESRRAAELERLVAEKTKELETLVESEECSSRLKDLIGRALEGNVTVDEIKRYRDECDAEGAKLLNTILDRARIAEEAKSKVAELEDRARDERDRPHALGDDADAETRALEVVRSWVEAKHDTTDDDANEFSSSWKAFFNRVLSEIKDDPSGDGGVDPDEVRKVRGISAEIKGFGELKPYEPHEGGGFDNEVSKKNAKKRDSIFDLIVQKKGNVRMVVRFNNKNDVIGKLLQMGALMYKEDPEDDANNLYDVQRKQNGDVITKKVKKWFGIKVTSRNTMRINYVPQEKIKSVSDNTLTSYDLSKSIPLGNVPPTGTRGNHHYTVIEKVPTKVKSHDHRKDQQYLMERIFTTETQEEVYECVAPFVNSAKQGKHVALIAYGGTGSGKTYTMGTERKSLGDSSRGILPRIMQSVRSKFRIKMVEVIPSVAPLELDVKNRMIDLVNPDNNFAQMEIRDANTGQLIPVNKAPADTFKIMHFFSSQKASMKSLEQCEYDKQTYDRYKDVKMSLYDVGKSDIYKAHLESASCVQKKTRVKVEIPDGLHSIECSGAPSSVKRALEQYNACLGKRRSEAKVGNSVSSRSHLVSMVELLDETDRTVGVVYVLDLAGKENQDVIERVNTQDSNKKTEGLYRNWEAAQSNFLTVGINQSLNALIELVKKKKELGSFSLPRKTNEMLKDLLTPAKLDPYKSPFETLMGPLWTRPDSKIMIIACGYPFGTNDEGEPQNFTYNKEVVSSVDDGWKEFFGMDPKSESPLKKLERDAKVYKQLSDVQKTQTRS